MAKTTHYNFVKASLGHSVRDVNIGRNLDLIDEALKALETKIKDIFIVSKNGNDSIADGSAAKPFLTVQAAIAAASGNCAIDVGPGEYSGDFELGANVVTCKGSGINATFFTGDVTCSTRAHSLKDVRIKNTGSLTITDVLFAQNLHCECSVAVSDIGMLDGHNMYIVPSAGVTPLTVAGNVMMNELSIVGNGNIHAIDQTGGTIVLFHSYVTNSAIGTSTISSIVGTLGLIDTSVANGGGGTAVNMENGGAAMKPNTLNGVVCSGNIVCGAAATYVGTLNFIAFGALSGSVLIYCPTSRLDNDSDITGATLKDALNTIDGRLNALEGV